MSKLDQLRAMREARLSQPVTRVTPVTVPVTLGPPPVLRDAFDRQALLRARAAERQRKSRAARRSVGGINLDLAAAAIARSTDG